MTIHPPTLTKHPGFRVVEAYGRRYEALLVSWTHQGEATLERIHTAIQLEESYGSGDGSAHGTLASTLDYLNSHIASGWGGYVILYTDFATLSFTFSCHAFDTGNGDPGLCKLYGGVILHKHHGLENGLGVWQVHT